MAEVAGSTTATLIQRNPIAQSSDADAGKAKPQPEDQKLRINKDHLLSVEKLNNTSIDVTNSETLSDDINNFLIKVRESGIGVEVKWSIPAAMDFADNMLICGSKSDMINFIKLLTV